DNPAPHPPQSGFHNSRLYQPPNIGKSSRRTPSHDLLQAASYLSSLASLSPCDPPPPRPPLRLLPGSCDCPRVAGALLNRRAAAQVQATRAQPEMSALQLTPNGSHAVAGAGMGACRTGVGSKGPGTLAENGTVVKGIHRLGEKSCPGAAAAAAAATATGRGGGWPAGG
ncbi:unnamed protein product, partial [Discosporangium mesarthrocarpum]